MKIALISAINNPTGKPFEGGVPVQVWWCAKKLMERGHDVTVFASGDSDPDFHIFPIIEKAVFKDEKLRHADGSSVMNRIHRYQRTAKVRQAYKKASKELQTNDTYDVIHNHSLFETPLLDAGSYKAPMVTTLHTPPFREIARGVKLAARQKKSRFISVSNALLKEWDGYNITADVVYNGLNMAEWNFNNHPQEKSAIWFGRITPQKAPHMAIQAARQAGYNLKIFGRIVDQNYFDEMIKPLLDPPNVDYHGLLDHAQLAVEIASSSVMLSTPQWEEAFGLTYIEAMACGTPVATFESGATGEIITKETGFIVPKNDVDGLSSALSKVEKLNRADCRAHVEKNFSLDHMIDAYEDIYKQMISRK